MKKVLEKKARFLFLLHDKRLQGYKNSIDELTFDLCSAFPLHVPFVMGD